MAAPAVESAETTSPGRVPRWRIVVRHAVALIVGGSLGWTLALAYRAWSGSPEPLANAAALVQVAVAVAALACWLHPGIRRFFAADQPAWTELVAFASGAAVAAAACLHLVHFTGPADCPERSSAGMTALQKASDGQCIGFTDLPTAGADHDFTFSLDDPGARSAQLALLRDNPDPGPHGVTLIWTGALSCGQYDRNDGARCSDGRLYQSEVDELTGLRALQQARRDTGQPVHIVIANTGQDVAQSRAVADLIVAHREMFGDEVAVIGLGDSRSTTRDAIGVLLDHAIPVISPTLTADQDGPGGPFVRRAGYIQLQPSNTEEAETLQTWAQDATRARRVLVYTDPATDRRTDLYVDSLVHDVRSVFKAHAWQVSEALGPSDLRDSKASLCQGSGPDSGPGSGAQEAAAVFFADRWYNFATFANAIGSLCGQHRPQLAAGDGSAGRFMINDHDRGSLTGEPWPFVYFTSGRQCSDLLKRPAASAFLAASRHIGQADCTAGQVAGHSTTAWDAGALAVALLTGHTQPALTDRAQADGFLSSLSIQSLHLAEGDVTVSGGIRQGSPLIPPTMLCVHDVHAGPRPSAAECRPTAAQPASSPPQRPLTLRTGRHASSATATVADKPGAGPDSTGIVTAPPAQPAPVDGQGNEQPSPSVTPASTGGSITVGSTSAAPPSGA